MLQQRPELTPDDVKRMLMSTAQPVVGTPQETGNGLINVLAAAAAPRPLLPQSFTRSTGLGTLEASRGTHNVGQYGSADLTGERDIFGHAWQPSVWAPKSSAGTAWSGGVWNGNTWAGTCFCKADPLWSATSWSATSWSATSWSATSWSATSWSATSWSATSWSATSWSATSWSATSWSGSSWSSASGYV
jgi:serine protease AprX